MPIQPAAESGRPRGWRTQPGWPDAVEESTTAWGACAWMLRHPTRLLCRWNWKAAVMSAITRGALFFAANLHAGVRAAAGAMLAEFLLRSVTSGFYGSVTQAFRRSEPRWAAALVTMTVLPLLSHALELAVHAARGTPNLAASIGASMGMTACSTFVNLHLMRCGVLIVGPGSRSLTEDLWQMLVLSRRGVRSLAAAPLRATGCRAGPDTRESPRKSY